MTQPQLFIFIAFLAAFTSNAFSQSLQDFSDVLEHNKIGQVVKKKVGKDISQRTLLGTVNDKKGVLKYYVVKEFLRVQAAIVYHGNSRIIFFNSKKKMVRQAFLHSNDELPFKLDNNCLYFYFLNSGVKRIFVLNIQVLPKMICVEPESCYELLSP
jgi:hypothetical protein